MSTSILSAVTAAGKLFAGYGTLTLGPVTFTGIALPASMRTGGTQELVVHTLPGGARDIEVMGPGFADKTWSGYLDGSTADIIRQTLDKMWQSGATWTLAWKTESYQVVIESFECDDKYTTPYKYTLSCKVLVNNSYTYGTTATSLALQVTSDLSNANPFAALSAVSQGIVGSSVTDAGTAAAAPNATSLGSAAYNSAVGAVNTAATAIQSATTAANNTLAPLGISLSSLSLAAPASLSTGVFAEQLTNAAQASGDLANLSAAQAYVQQAQQNLLRASA